MRRYLAIVIATLVVASLALASRGVAAEAEVKHDYRLDFKGTAGVKVRLLLVTKPTSGAAPERREEVVTLPARIDFKGVRCYAWIDTLADGRSGNDGDRCDVDLLKDGHLAATVETKIVKQNRQSGGLGDL